MWCGIRRRPRIINVLNVTTNWKKAKETAMHGYVAMYNRKKIEVRAADLYSAKQKAVAELGVRKKQEHMVSVMLAEKDGKPVVHTPDF